MLGCVTPTVGLVRAACAPRSLPLHSRSRRRLACGQSLPRLQAMRRVQAMGRLQATRHSQWLLRMRAWPRRQLPGRKQPTP
jgi:hypothetical protein